MALTFMALGILLSGMIQTIRLADGAAQSTMEARDQEMQLNWFRQSVGLSVLRSPAPAGEGVAAMTGNARTLSGLSLFVPGSGAAGPSEYRYMLGYDPQQGKTVLRMLTVLPSEGPLATTQSGVISSWPGTEGAFKYLDEDDIWRDEWPTASLSREAAPGSLGTATVRRNGLPKAVQLVYGAPARILVVAIHDRSIPPPTVKELAQ